MLHDMELPRYRHDSTGWPDQLIPLIQQRPLRFPVHSFRTLLADLGTIVKQRVQPNAAGSPPFDLVTRPTPQQEKVLGLLNLRLGRTR